MVGDTIIKILTGRHARARKLHRVQRGEFRDLQSNHPTLASCDNVAHISRTPRTITTA